MTDDRRARALHRATRAIRRRPAHGGAVRAGGGGQVDDTGARSTQREGHAAAVEQVRGDREGGPPGPPLGPGAGPGPGGIGQRGDAACVAAVVDQQLGCTERRRLVGRESARQAQEDRPGRGVDPLEAFDVERDRRHPQNPRYRGGAGSRLCSRAMRLLVTGGAGYIGSVVAARLLAAGHDVTVLDSLARGHRSAVPEGCELLEVDLLDLDAVSEALDGGFEGVLHFAALALVGESVEHPERYHRGNFVGTLNLLDAMRAHHIKRLVFSSTCATYGEPEEVPIHEGVPTAPVNSYGNSKLAVDRMIGDECLAHGLGAMSLRYFNVAGASGPLGEHHEPETHLIPLILQAAAGHRDSVADLRDGLPDARRHRGP